MGLLDIPRGLISRVPIVGGLVDSKPADEAPEDEPDIDEPDKVEDEPDEPADEPDEVEDEPEDEPDEPEAEAEQDEPEDDEPEAQPDSDPGGPGGEAEEPTGGNSTSDGTEDISDTTAPSIGPNTVIEKDSPEERLARHEQSDKDAMGLDKRREVIGGDYSASFGKQLFRWALVVIVAAAALFGLKQLVDDLDKAPAHAADRAPWTGTQQAPKPLE
jgi:hypothetical protein